MCHSQDQPNILPIVLSTPGGKGSLQAASETFTTHPQPVLLQPLTDSAIFGYEEYVQYCLYHPEMQFIIYLHR